MQSWARAGEQEVQLGLAGGGAGRKLRKWSRAGRSRGRSGAEPREKRGGAGRDVALGPGNYDTWQVGGGRSVAKSRQCPFDCSDTWRPVRAVPEA